jgi:hypothetical protein
MMTTLQHADVAAGMIRAMDARGIRPEDQIGVLTEALKLATNNAELAVPVRPSDEAAGRDGIGGGGGGPHADDLGIQGDVRGGGGIDFVATHGFGGAGDRTRGW